MNKINQLTSKLQLAHELSKNFTGGWSNDFLSAEDFSKALGEAIERLGNGDKAALTDLTIWFMPAGDWDDFVGIEGQDLANEIYKMLLSQA